MVILVQGFVIFLQIWFFFLVLLVKLGFFLFVSGVCLVFWCGWVQGWRIFVWSLVSGVFKFFWGFVVFLFLSLVLLFMYGCFFCGVYIILSCFRGDFSVFRVQCMMQFYGIGFSVCGQLLVVVLFGGQSCIFILFIVQSLGFFFFVVFICCVDVFFGFFGFELLNVGWIFVVQEIFLLVLWFFVGRGCWNLFLVWVFQFYGCGGCGGLCVCFLILWM